jgi:hypothetical protein
VERGCVGVDRRGALLGPEGSGRPVYRVVLVFLGHLLHRLCIPLGIVVGVVVWLGPAFIKLFWSGVCSGVCFPSGWMPGGAGGGCGWCSCPYFENCIVDASIFVVFCCVTSY